MFVSHNKSIDKSIQLFVDKTSRKKVIWNRFTELT